MITTKSQKLLNKDNKTSYWAILCPICGWELGISYKKENKKVITILECSYCKGRLDVKGEIDVLDCVHLRPMFYYVYYTGVKRPPTQIMRKLLEKTQGKLHPVSHVYIRGVDYFD